MSFGLGLGSSGVGSRKGYVLAPNPKVLSATLGTDGETLTVVFDKTMGAGTSQVGMRVWENGRFSDSVAAVYVSGAASTTLIFTTSKVFSAGSFLKLGYTQPGNGFISGSDLLLTFSGRNIVNNSTKGLTIIENRSAGGWELAFLGNIEGNSVLQTEAYVPIGTPDPAVVSNRDTAKWELLFIDEIDGNNVLQSEHYSDTLPLVDIADSVIDRSNGTTHRLFIDAIEGSDVLQTEPITP